MFKKDIDLVKQLHRKYSFNSPLLDAGGLKNPCVSDYEVSISKALHFVVNDSAQGISEHKVTIPHPEQSDRYVNVSYPWSFIDPNYTILNPEYGDPWIEDLPALYAQSFNTVVMVSVFEHVVNPYIVSQAIFDLLKPGGYFFNSTPFLFPYHPSPEDNFRYSPQALKHIHTSTGFNWIEGDFHINYSSKLGVGDTNPSNYGAPTGIMASFALCQKPF
jgi:hypothetical protein